MLASEVIDRTYSEWLEPAGINRPAWDKLASAITDTTGLSISLSGRQTNIPRDSILEIDAEQILVDSVSGSTVTAKERGYRETDPATHTLGTRVLLDPPYPRKAVFDALVSIISGLYPLGLYVRATDTTQTFDTSAVKTLPSGAKDIRSILVRSSSSQEQYYPSLRPGYDFDLFREFTPPKYQLKRGGAYGQAMTVLYTKDFTAPTSEATDLSATSGVPDSLQPYLPMAVAGYLLQGRELPRVQIEEVRRVLASQGVQVGAALNVGQSLLGQFQRVYVGAERKRLSEMDPPSFEWRGR